MVETDVCVCSSRAGLSLSFGPHRTASLQMPCGVFTSLADFGYLTPLARSEANCDISGPPTTPVSSGSSYVVALTPVYRLRTSDRESSRAHEPEGRPIARQDPLLACHILSSALPVKGLQTDRTNRGVDEKMFGSWSLLFPELLCVHDLIRDSGSYL